ncbi:MAG: SDR family oxidoreductase [Deltaproteobacteria bacterium]|nr:SDR family oxidoreductase [Deltaproteobacteria bacterium]
MAQSDQDIELGLRGRVALVTGSGAGIGRGIAGWLARAGCLIAVNDIDGAKAEETAALLRASGHEAKAFVANVRDEQAVAELVAHIRRELGGLDVAVNNVGMNAGMPATPFTEWRGDDFRAVVEQNLIATALCCVAEARAMVEQGRGGVILNVTSGETTRPAIRLAPYGAAKAAINHLTQTMAVELGPHGIRVNSIAPGTTLTEQVQKTFPESHVAAILESIPLRRMTGPDELGRLALYLASDLARCVTGQFMLADAGAFLSRSRPAMPAVPRVPDR